MLKGFVKGEDEPRIKYLLVEKSMELLVMVPAVVVPVEVHGHCDIQSEPFQLATSNVPKLSTVLLLFQLNVIVALAVPAILSIVQYSEALI